MVNFMEQRIFTVPIIHSMGTNSAGGGRAGVTLQTRDRANASIMVPKTGTVSVGIVVSAEQPRQGVQIYRGYAKGMGNFREGWVPPSGLTNINIGAADTGHRLHVLRGIQVQEGEFLGIRITNREEGYSFNLSVIFIEY
jgi:hypothetical protein